MPDSLTPFCVARWASNGRGHRGGDICGDSVFKRLGDVDLCNHHYWRSYDAVFVQVHREVQAQFGDREWEPDAAHVIYYLRRVSDGLIKIGYTTGLRHRMACLRADHGPLEILLTHRGSRSVEREIHEQFGRFRVEGEFFRPCHRLLKWIMEVRGGQDPERILPGTVSVDFLLAIQS